MPCMMQVAHLHHHGDRATSVSKHVPLQHMSTRCWREPVKLWVWQRRVSSPSLWFLDLSGLCSTLWLYEAILRDLLCQHQTHEFPSPKTGSGKKHPREGGSKGDSWESGVSQRMQDSPGHPEGADSVLTEPIPEASTGIPFLGDSLQGWS